MLETSQSWLADGTCKTAPALFQQVYVVHSLRGGPDYQHDGQLFPSVFIPLPNKIQATYTKL